VTTLGGAARLHLDCVDSTSLEAVRHRLPVWVSADRQIAARGRRGRTWDSPAGNLSLSLAYRPIGTPAELALRSFVASLALYDGLKTLGVDGLSLKWPNDVLLDGGKLAGILLEAPGRGVLVIGFGVNVARAPDAATLEPGAVPAATLAGAIPAAALRDALISTFEAREAQLVAHGFAATRVDWLARAARLGEPIVARTMTAVHCGAFETVDGEGRLVLSTPDGRMTIPAADVHFEAAACS
jgi:BirA family biotin operon repressor/biotin-[acetyl-CoA-carboxylase] ligase